ncbi:MAG: hypothetical protein GY721_08805, partial [Deltaproteobacteria bacterium]|nr:hypothetical protein [Deltaproteobacteria bacterium]
LFLQLDLQELPEELGGRYGDGMIQFFYCRNRQCMMEDKVIPEGLSQVSLVRLVDISIHGRPVTIKEGLDEPLAVSRIRGWKKQIDYHPDLDDIQELGIEITDEEHDLLADWGLLESGDKLAGWPNWIQYPEHMPCGECGRTMEFLYQLEPHVNLGYSFGQEYHDYVVEEGCSWLFQCREHKAQLAFTWQCH